MREKEIIGSARRLSDAVAEIEVDLNEGALSIHRSGIENLEWVPPLESAAQRAQAIASILPSIEVPSDWQERESHQTYASLRPNLPKILQKTAELPRELQEEAEYGLRVSPPEKSPVSQAATKRVRRIRDSLHRERNWLLRKLDNSDNRLEEPHAPPERVDMRGPIYTRDALPSFARKGPSSPRKSKEDEFVPAGSVSAHDYVTTRRYRIWFGTNRTINTTTPTHRDEADTLTLGSCVVYVPKTHKFGSVGSSWIRRTIAALLKGEEDDRIQLKETFILEPSDFKAQISHELRSWRKRTALVIVHGYNVSFKEAACRTAQIGFDLRVDGVTAFFAWPSLGTVLGYMHDEEAIQLAEPHFVEFLKVIGRIPEVEEIHILAHSMGNRLLFGTVERLAEASRAGTLRARIGQIILAAADVAVPLFLLRVPSYQQLATRRITSYSCDKDVALRASREVHVHDRVGLEPPVFIREGIDSVSAAELDLHALGHSYYAETDTVIYDIAEVLHSDTPPGNRMRLEPSSDSLYWIFK